MAGDYRRVTTIDAHVGGQALRLIVNGLSTPRGRTMRSKLEWIVGEGEGVRRMLMLEPRGHVDLVGACFTEPVSPGAHAGALFMNHRGFTGAPGSALVGAAIIGLTRGLVVPGGDGRHIRFDTPMGTVHAETLDGNPSTISLIGPPAFVLVGGVPVTVGGRTFRVDVAFGGGFFALVDGEAAGVGTDPAWIPELRRTSVAIAEAINSSYDIAHPVDESIRGLAGTIFTAPSNNSACDLRVAVVSAEGAVDRSPGGSSLGAVIAVLEAMGLVEDDRSVAVEGLANTSMRARTVQRTIVGEQPALLVAVTGSAWITGEHEFVVDPTDPLGDGLDINLIRAPRIAETRE